MSRLNELENLRIRYSGYALCYLRPNLRSSQENIYHNSKNYQSQNSSGAGNFLVQAIN